MIRAGAAKPAVSESIPRQITTRGPMLTVKAVPNGGERRTTVPLRVRDRRRNRRHGRRIHREAPAELHTSLERHLLHRRTWVESRPPPNPYPTTSRKHSPTSTRPPAWTSQIKVGYKRDSLVADSLTARVRCTAAPRTPLSAVYAPVHRPRSEQRSPCPQNAEERHRCLSYVLCPVERLSWCR